MVDIEERCEAICPLDTPWSIEAKKLSLISRALNIKTRCTLPKGHPGCHIGPDDEIWLDARRTKPVSAREVKPL